MRPREPTRPPTWDKPNPILARRAKGVRGSPEGRKAKRAKAVEPRRRVRKRRRGVERSRGVMEPMMGERRREVSWVIPVRVEARMRDGRQVVGARSERGEVVQRS